MNKTVNINLAGIFFHIDEDAYLKLQRYLEAIKRSFTNSQGRDEIIADIEARIAELFNERMQNDKQVIGVKEVDEIVTIMGEPEDYLIDDDIFEDEPRQGYAKSNTNTKRLFRDTDNSYIGGVCSGLSHYLGLDPIWIRFIWILLILSAGTGVLVYILLWILVPEAKTTAEKLMMRGEPVNISNIEKKIKDGFENVSNSVKNVDLKKHGDKLKEGFEHVSGSINEGVKRADFSKQGQRFKSTSTSFFDAVGTIVMFILNVFAKFFGLLLIIFGALLLLGLIISVFSLGTSSYFHPWWMDYPEVLNTTGMPIWLGGFALFLFLGIPFFFISYLGLKILINNLKSIGKVAKLTLLGLWVIALFSIIFMSARQASYFSSENSTLTNERLNLNTNDTLQIKMVSTQLNRMNSNSFRNNSFEITYDENDQKVIYSRNIHVSVRSTKDSVATIRIEKQARGRNFMEARKTADFIDYHYEINNNQLLLDNFIVTDYDNKFLDQKVDITIYLPEATLFRMHQNTSSFLNSHASGGNLMSFSDVGHLLKVTEDGNTCLDCLEEERFKVKVDLKDGGASLKINENGIEANSNTNSFKADSTGIKAKTDSVRVNIDSNGIEISTDSD
ncbi:PspC domain-containing protein [Subsaximicrobium wynnwilliamsii]|uniref:PspC domain-containing protein n=1 Tax=Subsaximicrobium wynnwilliamsii TaxID=291179 RepID=A0A5C6ZN15_9FLAO|nr:PspC domain-containing protein [Subsaximicrobium wynnwilliamsii]TXD85196.1 PspC domain-containing protein [Subsaximicrobium wynnwilliamsii]TXD91239.1 PspC domain-containing protein [Subsaximicrobium wynnwilliamsii]TXE04632.1 PspC domain-containing protein [Subsaximicrobium wynnwilliamsii]